VTLKVVQGHFTARHVMHKLTQCDLGTTNLRLVTSDITTDVRLGWPDVQITSPTVRHWVSMKNRTYDLIKSAGIRVARIFDWGGVLSHIVDCQALKV